MRPSHQGWIAVYQTKTEITHIPLVFFDGPSPRDASGTIWNESTGTTHLGAI